MPREARLEQVGNGFAPVSGGWFVVNAADAAWVEHDLFGHRCKFDLDGRVGSARPELELQMFGEIGYTLAVLRPGKPTGMYHAEDVQEDFFVVSGSCTAIVEDQEVPLRRFDFLHCPAGTNHTLIGGEDGAVVLMIGNRATRSGINYPVSDVAGAYGGSVEQETSSPAEAYAPFGHWRTGGEKPKL